MKEKLGHAIKLRQEGKYEQSLQILLDLATQFPEDASISYQCACSFDVLGQESQAVPYYEKAIERGLNSEDLQSAYVQLGSTYRTLGEYEKSKEAFQEGLTLFPENRAMQSFFAMTLYNVQEHQQAMEILLGCLMETTTDEDILRYKRAITFYKNQLDVVWE